MNQPILSQASTLDIVRELKSRIDAGFAPNMMPLMIGAEELNALMTSIEVYLVNQYAEQCGYYPELTDV